MGVLRAVEEWVQQGAEGTSVLWLHGPAGAGKSAIAQTVAETWAGRNQLAASFFFARTVVHRNDVKYLFPTIAVQIALSSPENRQRLHEIMNNDPYIAERDRGSVDLVASFFQHSSEVDRCSPSLILIDGLDECQGHDDQCSILGQVSHMIHVCCLPLRFLIVSRPESHIREAFEDLDLAIITQVLSLYGDDGASSDVSTFLRTEFSRIYNAKMHRDIMQFVPGPWPSDDIIQRLVTKSEGYFIYASTLIKFIDEEYFSPAARLDQVLGTSNSSVFHSELNPFAELDQLYTQILSSYPKSQLPMLKLILGYVVMPFIGRTGDYLPIEDILNLPPGQMKLTLRGLRSLVSFWRLSQTPVLIHASFGDFLLDKARSKDYHIDSEEWIYTVFRPAFFLGCRLICRSLQPHECTSPLKGRSPISLLGSIRN